MALEALSLSRVRAMDESKRADYFENFARYFEDGPKPYAIRVGSTTLTSHDTRDLRAQFDRLLDQGGSMTPVKFDWSRYKVCPTCKAAAGEACVHTRLETTKGNPVYIDEPHPKRKKSVMTVAEAKRIVRDKYPDAITGVVRQTGWIAAKIRPYGSSIGDYAMTHGEAWKRAAARILKQKQEGIDGNEDQTGHGARRNRENQQDTGHSKAQGRATGEGGRKGARSRNG